MVNRRGHNTTGAARFDSRRKALSINAKPQRLDLQWSAAVAVLPVLWNSVVACGVQMNGGCPDESAQIVRPLFPGSGFARVETLL